MLHQELRGCDGQVQVHAGGLQLVVHVAKCITKVFATFFHQTNLFPRRVQHLVFITRNVTEILRVIWLVIGSRVVALLRGRLRVPLCTLVAAAPLVPTGVIRVLRAHGHATVATGQ